MIKLVDGKLKVTVFADIKEFIWHQWDYNGGFWIIGFTILLVGVFVVSIITDHQQRQAAQVNKVVTPESFYMSKGPVSFGDSTVSFTDNKSGKEITLTNIPVTVIEVK